MAFDNDNVPEDTVKFEPTLIAPNALVVAFGNRAAGTVPELILDAFNEVRLAPDPQKPVA